MKRVFITALIIAIVLGIIYAAMPREDEVVVEQNVTPSTQGAVIDPAPTPEPTTVVVPVETTVTPLAVLEDSRCPANANCIQAGTVRVRVRIGGTQTEEAILTLGQPKVVAGKTITLTAVSPQAIAGKTYAFNDYKFTFSVK